MDKIFDFGNKYKSSNADSFSFYFSTYEYLKTCFLLKARRFVKKLYSRADGSGFLKNIRTLTRKDGDKKRERERVYEKTADTKNRWARKTHRTTRQKITRQGQRPSLDFIRLLRVVITPSVTTLWKGENESKQSDEFQATKGQALVNILIVHSNKV